MNFFKRPIITDQIQDDTLLDHYKNDGDIAVLGKLFERYMYLIYGVCLKYLADEEEAKDAVMGIFEELVTKAKKHEIRQFKPWLYVLSRNYCLMQLRAQKKINTVLTDDIMELEAFLHPDSIDLPLNDVLLRKCMERLPIAQRESVLLFYFEEKCYKEIAAHTGFTLNEVKSYIQNGKRNLKICIENDREQ
jgi:RNA polymerase sigma-70 factor (ECF subfamily)